MNIALIIEWKRYYRSITRRLPVEQRKTGWVYGLTSQKVDVRISTQVATFGRPLVSQKSGVLKHGRVRPHRLMGRFSDSEKEIVLRKVQEAGMSVNEFIRALALGRDYQSPELYRILAATYRELIAQGRNLNQLTRLSNRAGYITEKAQHGLAVFSRPYIDTLNAVQSAVSRSMPHP